MKKLQYLQNSPSRFSYAVGSVFVFFLFRIIRVLCHSGANTVESSDVLFPRIAVMNVFSHWLMHIPVMNHYRRIDQEILMLKVIINYLSQRCELLPKIDEEGHTHVKNGGITL